MSSIEITNELMTIIPREIAGIIIDKLEYLKYTDFTKEETHSYWANRFRINYKNCVNIHYFLKRIIPDEEKKYNFNHINNIRKNTNIYNIPAGELHKLLKANFLLSQGEMDYLNEIHDIETSRNHKYYDDYLQKEILTMFMYSQSNVNDNTDYKENIDNIINNSLVSMKGKIYCNNEVIKIINKYLMELKETFEVFLRYFKDYTQSRSFLKSLKTTIINSILNKLKTINKYLEYVKTI
jgi:hypothetical protein